MADSSLAAASGTTHDASQAEIGAQQTKPITIKKEPAGGNTAVKRLQYSCSECHRRKQKCNRELPCNHCSARRVPDRCRPFQPGDDPYDLMARVSKLETLCEHIPSMLGMLERLTANHDKSAVALQALLERQSTPSSFSRRSRSSPLRNDNPHPWDLTEEGPNGLSPKTRTHALSSSSSRQAPPSHPSSSVRNEEEMFTMKNMDHTTGMYSSTGAMAGPLNKLLDTIGDATPDAAMGKRPESHDLAKAASSRPIRPVAISKHAEGKGVDAALQDAVMTQTLEARSTRQTDQDGDLASRLLKFAVSSDEVNSIQQNLPSERLGRQLAMFFFYEVNWIRIPLPKTYIMKAWEAFWESGQQLTQVNINSAASLCATCALAVLSADLEDQDHDELRNYIPDLAYDGTPEHLRLLVARRLAYTAQRTLLLSGVLGHEELSRVISYIQIARFLYLDRRLDEAHAAAARGVRSAIALGLHRDGTLLGFDAVTTQLRRVVWSMVRWLDKTISFAVGRPSAIIDSTCDARPPDDVAWQEEWPYLPLQRPRCTPIKWNNLPTPPASEPRPTCLAYAAVGAQLGDLFQELVTINQNVTTQMGVHEFSQTIKALDEKVLAFGTRLPSYFQVTRTTFSSQQESYQQPLDNELPFLPVQRFLIHTEVGIFRLALYRTLLLRAVAHKGSKTSKAFPWLRDRCARTALADIANRSHFLISLKENFWPKRPPMLYAIQLSPFKSFYAHVTAAVVLLLEASQSTDGVAFADPDLPCDAPASCDPDCQGLEANRKSSKDRSSQQHRAPRSWAEAATNISVEAQERLSTLGVYRLLYQHLANHVRKSSRWGSTDSGSAQSSSGVASNLANATTASTSGSSVDGGHAQPLDMYEQGTQVLALFLARIAHIRAAHVRRSKLNGDVPGDKSKKRPRAPSSPVPPKSAIGDAEDQPESSESSSKKVRSNTTTGSDSRPARADPSTSAPTLIAEDELVCRNAQQDTAPARPVGHIETTTERPQLRTTASDGLVPTTLSSSAGVVPSFWGESPTGPAGPAAGPSHMSGTGSTDRPSESEPEFDQELLTTWAQAASSFGLHELPQGLLGNGPPAAAFPAEKLMSSDPTSSINQAILSEYPAMAQLSWGPPGSVNVFGHSDITGDDQQPHQAHQDSAPLLANLDQRLHDPVAPIGPTTTSSGWRPDPVYPLSGGPGVSNGVPVPSVSPPGSSNSKIHSDLLSTVPSRPLEGSSSSPFAPTVPAGHSNQWSFDSAQPSNTRWDHAGHNQEPFLQKPMAPNGMMLGVSDAEVPAGLGDGLDGLSAVLSHDPLAAKNAADEPAFQRTQYWQAFIEKIAHVDHSPP